MEEDSEPSLEEGLEKPPLVEMDEIMKKINEGKLYLIPRIAALNSKMQEEDEEDSGYKRGK